MKNSQPLPHKISKISLITGIFLAAAGCVSQALSQPIATKGYLPTIHVTREEISTPLPTETEVPREVAFDGQRALEDIQYQVELGDRIPGSETHAQVVEWMEAELQQAGWSTEIQAGEMLGHPIRNVIAKRESSSDRWVIFGAHYDTRMYADRDPNPDKRRQYVPGANDAASGVAVLLELARVLPADTPADVWLVLFDAEDNGNIPGWDWILGSKYFAQQLVGEPEAVVIVDMIGDADLDIYYEDSSNPQLRTEIWAVAAELGYSQFIPEVKHRLIDDHTPFLKRGIPAVDLIDFDYPYWHTTHDTPDKVSAESLAAVGETLLAWLTQTP